MPPKKKVRQRLGLTARSDSIQRSSTGKFYRRMLRADRLSSSEIGEAARGAADFVDMVSGGASSPTDVCAVAAAYRWGETTRCTRDVHTAQKTCRSYQFMKHSPLLWSPFKRAGGPASTRRKTGFGEKRIARAPDSEWIHTRENGHA